MPNLTPEKIQSLNHLIVRWDNEEPDARNLLINEIEPWIKKFSTMDFTSGYVVNTPLKMFSSQDLAQTIALNLTAKFPNVSHKFNNIEDMLIKLRLMMFRTVLNEAKKLTSAQSGDRVPIDNCDEYQEAEDKSVSFLKFELISDRFEALGKSHRTKVLAWTLNTFHNASIEEIAQIMDISIVTVRKHIKHIKLSMISAIKDCE